MTQRFKVISILDAVERGLIAEGNYTHNAIACLFDYNQDPPRYVACDGGEPEDQLLWRDWSWVVEELNNLAAETR